MQSACKGRGSHWECLGEEATGRGSNRSGDQKVRLCFLEEPREVAKSEFKASWLSESHTSEVNES